jgi:hypothetical protein
MDMTVPVEALTAAFNERQTSLSSQHLIDKCAYF